MTEPNNIAILDPAVALATDEGWNDQAAQWKSIIGTGIPARLHPIAGYGHRSRHAWPRLRMVAD